MTNGSGENNSSDDERAAQIDDAIARSQHEEREERESDLARQRDADERIVRALAERDAAPDGGRADA